MTSPQKPRCCQLGQVGVTAFPSPVLPLHTRLQDHPPAQLLPLPSVRPQGAPVSLHRDPRRNASAKRDWLSSGSSPSKFPFIRGCPVRVLCFLYLSSASFQTRSQGSHLPWVPGTTPEPLLQFYTVISPKILQRESCFLYNVNTGKNLSASIAIESAANHLVESVVKLP